jgi:hypothetical protein
LVSIRVDDSTSPPLPSPPQTHHLPPFLFSLSLSLSQRGRGGEGVRGEREGQRRRGEGEEGEVRQNSATDMDLGLRIAHTPRERERERDVCVEHLCCFEIDKQTPCHGNLGFHGLKLHHLKPLIL